MKMPTNVSSLSIKATTKIQYKLIYGSFIHTPDLSTLEICMNSLIGVDESGTIDFVIKNFDQEYPQVSPLDYFKSNYSNDEIEYLDYSTQYCKFFIPGFIDTHIHASQYPNIGVGLNTPLLNWLNDYTFPLELRFSHDYQFAKEVYTKVIFKTLNNGTTCGSYFTTIDANSTNLFADLLLEIGQRGFVGKVCMDHNDTFIKYQESFQECINSMNDIISHLNEINPKGETLVKPIVTPRFAPVCSRELLQYLGELSVSEDLPIQTHISENKSEIELVSDTFPECDNYAGVYDKFKLLTDKTILAHAIHLTEAEIQLVKERKCSISHCPTSNTFISSGEASVYKYLHHDNINVSLGTDVSGGFESSILKIIKHSILVSHHLSMHEKSSGKVSIKDAIYMATMGGAKAVNLQDEVGSFEKGKKFDAQLIDLDGDHSPIDIFQFQLPKEKEETKDEKIANIYDLLSKWIFAGDDRNCIKVWCNGRLVVDKI